MSIATEISRLQSAKSSLKTSINAKLSSGLIDDETIDEYADFVDNIQTGGGEASYKIITAELPNVTINLYNESSTLLDTKTTDATLGGYVVFDIETSGTYTINAYNSGETLLWTNTVVITDIGIYNCKTGKTLNSYTWAEIETASVGGYAKYMWSVADYKDLSSFLGQTTSAYTMAVVLGFDHDTLASDGTTKTGITFKLPDTSSTYQHWTAGLTNINGISWIGSLIRGNCLKTGEDQYVYDTTVTDATEGTYYTLNADNETFSSVTLPTGYVSGTKYYNKTTLSTDGAFITGLPSDLASVIKQVEKETWGGYGLSAGSRDNTIVKTKDWLFINSDSEVFGDSNRYFNDSKNTLEGPQYEYFKKYEENRFVLSASAWLRSPSVNSSAYFCSWSSKGIIINGSANNSFRVDLCFCI